MMRISISPDSMMHLANQLHEKADAVQNDSVEIESVLEKLKSTYLNISIEEINAEFQKYKKETILLSLLLHEYAELLINHASQIRAADIAIELPPPSPQEKQKIRDWWFEIIRTTPYKKLCYAVLLMLPSDQEAINYLRNYSDELDIITQEIATVLVFSSSVSMRNPDGGVWDNIVDQHISKNYSVRLANLLGLDFTKFPCLVLFQDIRSPNFIAISLKDKTALEISQELRNTFSIVNDSIKKQIDPLYSLTQYYKSQEIKEKGGNVLEEVRNVAQLSLKAVIDAWIKSSFS